MRKTLKCVVCLALIMGIFSSLAFCVFADNNFIRRQKAIDFLLSAGWTMERIDDLLTEEALLEYADAKSVISSEKKYFKVTDEDSVAITESECMNAVAAIENANSGVSVCAGGDTIINEITTTDGYLTYFVEVYSFGDGTYMLSGRYEWLITPQNRRIDVFAVNHSNHLVQLSNSSEVYYVYKADHYSAPGTLSTSETHTPDEMFIDVNAGTAVKQKLLGSLYASFINHRGYLQYKVKFGNLYDTDAAVNAEYLHQQGLYEVNPSLSYPAGLSIGVSHSTFFKRMSPNPYLSFSRDF